jgi:hypothetical protein
MAEIWVLVDTVKSQDSTQSFLMYWGKNGAGDSSNSRAVLPMSNGFAGVWHFNGTNFNDATANGNNGVGHGSIDTIGVIGGAKAFHGNLANPMYVAILDAPSLNFTAAITMSAWIKPSAWASNNRIMQKNGTAGADDQYRFFASSNTAMQMTIPGTSGTSPTATAPSTGAWTLIHGTWNGTGGNIRLYNNGALAVTSSGAITGALATGTGGELNIGRKPLAGVDADYGNMVIDEPRLSSVARDSNWIELEYQTQKPGAMAVTLGATAPAAPTVPNLISPANNATVYSSSANLTWTASAGATSYHVQVSTDSGFTTTVFSDSTLTTTTRNFPYTRYGIYYWRVNAKNVGGTSAYSTTWNFTTAPVGIVPQGFTLQRLNLGNGESLRFGLPQKSHVVIQLFNSQGRMVSQLLDETRDTGYYNVSLSIEAKGSYFLDFRAGDFHKTMKIER